MYNILLYVFRERAPIMNVRLQLDEGQILGKLAADLLVELDQLLRIDNYPVFAFLQRHFDDASKCELLCDHRFSVLGARPARILRCPTSSKAHPATEASIPATAAIEARNGLCMEASRLNRLSGPAPIPQANHDAVNSRTYPAAFHFSALCR
jgi:hypothetical protein